MRKLDHVTKENDDQTWDFGGTSFSDKPFPTFEYTCLRFGVRLHVMSPLTLTGVVDHFAVIPRCPST